MKFTVQRPFRIGDDLVTHGQIVDLPMNLRAQKLVDSRYLLPVDPAVADVTTSPENIATDTAAGLRDPPGRGRGRPRTV